MQTIEELIAEAKAFNGMSQEHLELIAGCGANHSGSCTSGSPTDSVATAPCSTMAGTWW